MIVVVDYGMGNLASVVNMFKKAGATDIVISSKAQDILMADRLVLPGVGHFSTGMKQLEDRGLIEVLNEAVLDKQMPILGICLGMQLMCEYSEEGNRDGLGWLSSKVISFKHMDDPKLNIPHMGWGIVKRVGENEFTRELEELSRFYHVHSYFIPESECAVFHSFYGREFVSGIKDRNIIGVQFHPEKSHRNGMRLIENYLNISG